MRCKSETTCWMFKGKVKHKRTQIDQFLATVRSLGNCEMIWPFVHIIYAWSKGFIQWCYFSQKIPYVLCAECAYCSLQANMWHALRSRSFCLNLHMYGDLWTSYKYMGINNYLFLQETVFIGIKEGNKHHVSLWRNWSNTWSMSSVLEREQWKRTPVCLFTIPQLSTFFFTY